MRKLLFLLTFALLGATLVAQVKPFVIPELRQWEASNGTFLVHSGTNITVSKAATPAVKEVAHQLKQDARSLVALDLKLRTSNHPKMGDITLQLDTTLLRDKGTEAYQIHITPKGIVLAANTTQGLYWGTRTLLQLMEQNHALPTGKIVDYPAYPMRGFTIDVARKFFTLEYLDNLAKTLSYYKMNVLHVHLNDNGFYDHFGKDWDKVYAAFRLESSTYPGLTAKDGSYGKDEFRHFQKEAQKRGVMVIPEIDIPAHSLAFSHYKPSLGSKEYGMDHIDLFNPETFTFFDALFKEYLEGDDPVFVGPYVHIGTDEYSNKDQKVVEQFRYFTDYYIKQVQSYGKKAGVWGALTHAKGKTPVTVKDVLMYCWYNGYANPSDMIKLGYNILSVPDASVYIVPGVNYYHDFLNTQKLYDEWTPANVGAQTFADDTPQIKGGMFSIWNDHVGNGISMQDASYRIFPALQTLAAKMWDGKHITIPYATFNTMRQSLSEAPGVNQLARITPQMRLQHTRLQDLGYNYRVSFTIKADENKKGTKLFSSDQSVVYLADPVAGKLGYSRNGYDYHFEYSIPVGQAVRLAIEGTASETRLYVNGKLQETKGIYMLDTDPSIRHKRRKYQTLVFPLAKQHTFKGKLSDLKIEYFGEKPITPAP